MTEKPDDERPQQEQVARDVREHVARGDEPPAPPAPDDVDDEAAYGTERQQGAAQPGPGDEHDS